MIHSESCISGISSFLLSLTRFEPKCFVLWFYTGFHQKGKIFIYNYRQLVKNVLYKYVNHSNIEKRCSNSDFINKIIYETSWELLHVGRCWILLIESIELKTRSLLALYLLYHSLEINHMSFFKWKTTVQTNFYCSIE